MRLLAFGVPISMKYAISNAICMSCSYVFATVDMYYIKPQDAKNYPPSICKKCKEVQWAIADLEKSGIPPF